MPPSPTTESPPPSDASDAFTAGAIETLAKSVGTRGAVEVIKSYVTWGRDLLAQDITDLEALGSAAHGLRPCAEVLGLNALNDCCRRIGIARRGGSALDIGAESARLRALLNDALSYLETRLTHMQSSGPASGAPDGTERP